MMTKPVDCVCRQKTCRCPHLVTKAKEHPEPEEPAEIVPEPTSSKTALKMDSRPSKRPLETLEQSGPAAKKKSSGKLSRKNKPKPIAANTLIYTDSMDDFKQECVSVDGDVANNLSAPAPSSPTSSVVVEQTDEEEVLPLQDAGFEPPVAAATATTTPKAASSVVKRVKNSKGRGGNVPEPLVATAAATATPKVASTIVKRPSSVAKRVNNPKDRGDIVSELPVANVAATTPKKVSSGVKRVKNSKGRGENVPQSPLVSSVIPILPSPVALQPAETPKASAPPKKVSESTIRDFLAEASDTDEDDEVDPSGMKDFLDAAIASAMLHKPFVPPLKQLMRVREHMLDHTPGLQLEYLEEARALVASVDEELRHVNEKNLLDRSQAHVRLSALSAGVEASITFSREKDLTLQVKFLVSGPTEFTYAKKSSAGGRSSNVKRGRGYSRAGEEWVRLARRWFSHGLYQAGASQPTFREVIDAFVRWFDFHYSKTSDNAAAKRQVKKQVAKKSDAKTPPTQRQETM